ncbi:pyrimidine/purine nucleoside phosphorylase [Spongiibacter marinus]|uniref:pyrimidine/purine nucleoside phosphorylase n=1 Tax=Spongiibacter marinus TaxID=354246 RepID=UPI00195F941C|nr:pyrimidine/purine nucleoside phosphorylase [uncultured Spongiibacter sp.]MBM7422892.1 hypothetical protein [Spongiibacter marinus]MEE2653867.1 pyrimidine/purine nucleoside phosphorylase [Pseudomonadota bacterium]
MIKHNSYFDEKVQSLGFEGKTQPVSVGVMEAGEYRFGTEAAERMQVITGALVVLLPGSSDWQRFSAGQSFDVPANSAFDLKVEETSAYACFYG